MSHAVYDIELRDVNGVERGMLTLDRKGSELTGSFVSESMSAKVAGSATGGEFSLSGTLFDAQNAVAFECRCFFGAGSIEGSIVTPRRILHLRAFRRLPNLRAA